MSTIFTRSAWLKLFALSSLSVLANLLGATVVWGQSTDSSTSTTKTSPILKQTQSSLVPQLHQLEQPTTNAADLLLNCDNELSKISHTSFKCNLQAQTEQLDQTDFTTEREEEESNLLQPTKDRLRINFGNEDPDAFIFGFGSKIGEPAALQGGRRVRVSSTISQLDVVFPVGGFLQQGFGPNQRLLLEFIGDIQGLGLDLTYTLTPQTIPGAFSINASTQRTFVGVFEGGDDVNLPGGADPWVHRSGGGVEYLIPFSSQFSLASAFNYQLVSVRTGAVTNQVESRDEQGNQVTVSDDGQDTLLTFNLSSLWATVDDPGFPTKGSRLRFGIDTSIPIGDASIAYGRFTGNFSQFVPVDFFGFNEGPRTLILNLQAGTMVGDVPPYEAFSMGGSSTVRGYGGGEVGSGSSFVLASAEYRFPVVNDLHILVDFDLQGSLFFDYGTNLDTAGDVIGEPGNVRGKPGDGFGYGFGLHAKTGFGLVRMEFALNDDGDFTTYFTVGDRY